MYDDLRLVTSLRSKKIMKMRCKACACEPLFGKRHHNFHSLNNFELLHVRIHEEDTDVYDTRVGADFKHQVLYVISLLLTFYYGLIESRMRFICDYS